MTKPWEDAPDLWKDEKAYCQWLRSQSRRIWARHPIKNRYKAASTVPKEELLPLKRVKFEAAYPRAKKACDCEMCGEFFPASQIEVDHIDEAGSFTTVEEWKVWLDRLLLLGFDGIRLLCKDCHLKVTLSQRFKCDIRDVWVYQRIAEFNKLKAAPMRQAFKDVGLSTGVALVVPRMKDLFKQHMMRNIKHD
ncbi:hypothetical protein NVP1077O_39 [Vibrio phage 1.077.O._10N.261.45.A10]|nr:hypothetical protein NVP1077O_39 [Vibrio phage 1.077.O._10N.261.45.A10]